MNTHSSRGNIYLAAALIILALVPGCEKEEKINDAEILQFGSVADISGNLYSTIKIGQQDWMAENLRTTKYNNGKDIKTNLSPEGWMNTEEGAYGIYPHKNIDGLNSESDVVEAYGIHYNWYAVESGNLCPAGWRVPGTEDWQGMLTYFIDNFDHIDFINVGNFLKSCRQVDSFLGGDCNTDEHPRWLPAGVNYYAEELNLRFTEWENLVGKIYEAEDLAGTDEFGFSATPAGIYFPGFSYGLGYMSEFWTSTRGTVEIPVTDEEGETIFKFDAFYQHNINNGPHMLSSSGIGKGLPVRCVRGEAIERVPTFRVP